MKVPKTSQPGEGVRRRLVLIESGAPGIPEVDPSYDETAVIAQLTNEPSIEFADRALHRLAAAELTQEPFSQAILCTTGVGEATQAARRLIALGVAAHAASAHTLRELVLCAPEHATHEERALLMELTDDLVMATEAPTLPVRLRFVEPSAPVFTPLPPHVGPALHASRAHASRAPGTSPIEPQKAG